MSRLSEPHFHNEAAAYAHLEALLWPEGPVCPCAGRSKIGPRGGGNLGHCGGRSLTLPRSKNREKRNPYARFGGPMNSIRGH